MICCFIGVPDKRPNPAYTATSNTESQQTLAVCKVIIFGLSLKMVGRHGAELNLLSFRLSLKLKPARPLVKSHEEPPTWRASLRLSEMAAHSLCILHRSNCPVACIPSRGTPKISWRIRTKAHEARMDTRSSMPSQFPALQKAGRGREKEANNKSRHTDKPQIITREELEAMITVSKRKDRQSEWKYRFLFNCRCYSQWRGQDKLTGRVSEQTG